MVSKIKRQLASLPTLAKAALLLLTLLLLLAAILLPIFLIPRHRREQPLPPATPPRDNCSTAANAGPVAFDFSPFLVKYRSGCVHRMDGTDRVPAGLDAATGVTSKDVLIDHATGLSARMYLPPPATAGENKKEDDDVFPVLVFYHGGAFVIMSPFEPKYHAYLNALVARARVVAVSVDYRLAPEHPLPAAYDDSWAALHWVAKNARAGPEPWLRDRGNLSRLYLAGDSAGANIVHNMAMRAGNESGGAAIRGILLLDPYFWGKRPVGAETTDPATRRQYEVTWSFVCAGRYGIDDPRIDPLATPPAELRRLACSRVAVTVSGLDDFEARGKAYAAALNASGWDGEIVQYETAGERHVYFLDAPASPKSAKELAFAAGYLSRE
ncbi:probable carboxylesterase 2 [Lolium perenne]|uniref:probable carboxylesterase 2 n=1 Tax=Lolium perenne TaxID=4522 RepID=UPI0021EA1B1E|nr:probable carboxylesterase 2 [Lolium perenne]